MFLVGFSIIAELFRGEAFSGVESKKLELSFQMFIKMFTEYSICCSLKMPRYDDRSASTRLYVGHLASRTRSRDLEYLFSKYGR